MEKQWRIAEQINVQIAGDLQMQLNVNRIVAQLLKQRQINSYSEAKSFFRPDLKQLHDPFLMKGMHLAIERIQAAILKNECVMIYGDYDVDGTTAVSIVYSFFKQYIEKISYYIPDRYKEGYGISLKGIDYAKQNNISLIIALDCGIKANDKIEYANKNGIDFIICDHHLPGNILPDAYSILDQKQLDCNYPYKELSGAGIGFKLIQAYSIIEGLRPDECYQYLDLVATSIAADVVPITGENRIMAHYGLEIINNSPRPGIKALLNLNDQKNPVNISTLVFTLAPRINAAGRIEHGSKSVELLSCEDDSLAFEYAKAINETNTQRKDIDSETTQEALAILENDPLSLLKKTTVLFNNKWHKGIVGIVASRLIEKYYRPTIILTESDGKISGSARSVKDFDVYNAIEKCSDLLEQFGGHKYAAGLTLNKENIKPFQIKFEKIVSESITEDQLIPKIEIDTEIEFHEINDKLLRIIKQFAPHGPENMTPVLLSKQVYETGWGKVFGKNHLKLELFQKSNPNIRFNAIAYNKGDFIHFFQRKVPMDIVFKIQENEFNGIKTIQLVVEDFKVSE